MIEIFKLFPNIAKFGFESIFLFAIIVVIYLNNKTEKEQITMRKEELKTFSHNNNNLVEKLENLTNEVIKMHKTNIEMTTKSDTNSQYHNIGIDEIKKQIVSMHERINTINAKQTEGFIMLKEIKVSVDRCKNN